jgi:ferredoxin-type protein NapH
MPEVTKVIGLMWAVISVTVIFILLRKGKMNRLVGISAIVISTLFGLILISPMLPLQFQNLFSAGTFGKSRVFVISLVILAVIVVSSAFIGRLYCGYSCPIGAAQELLHHVPVPKLKIGGKWLLMGFRWVFLGGIIIFGLFFGISLLALTGAGSFFKLDAGSWTFYIFFFLLLVSVFYYRPFCRIFCPIGALMAVFALIRGYRFRRNEECMNCRKCEVDCPVDEAGADGLKMECYACSRCYYSCPFNALDYSLR